VVAVSWRRIGEAGGESSRGTSKAAFKSSLQGNGAGNNRNGRFVWRGSGRCRLQKTSQKDDQPMTFRSRIALGASAAVVSLGLALSPAAFAQDKMGKDDGMKKDSMSKDAMKKDDGMKKDGMMKNDAMSKDGMKKDDAMKKN
jgi:pentapeptide MXKDX repeat protein